MPDKKRRFHLYSDTSKFAKGSVLYQIQNGKTKLIDYMRKRLPEAAHNYSITELETCGLAINIASFAHLLKMVDFGAIVDHLALMHIMKSKMEKYVRMYEQFIEQLKMHARVVRILSKGYCQFHSYHHQN